MTDYSQQVLPGEGADDYARYMRTDTLLALQRRPDEVVHRDELLFQVVHQSTELWLKLACAELDEATERIKAGELETATRLIGRSSLGIELVTGQLDMMKHLSPWDFQTIRTVLGHGSGADSPGWRAVRKHGRKISSAFGDLVAQRGIDLAELYRSKLDSVEQRLAEALIEWDERVALWRASHYKMATRILGHGSVGTQGMAVDALTKLIKHQFLPDLWRARSELTDTGPMGTGAA
ncbi:tryptophan 2,3-dioxygenase [Actinosynnema sp. ALI-1.44]|uniref:tryptophan 2,3-dioxygenase family protein n=1 Tax=Actinosynnema sp. ALI-1.44 TaxID=1933779 RepID=UPI00097BEB4D|nr:tryptophan 2,3-dioxygenase family protein [Actinosynnema sp. ALI-1.44]ONI78076.1 tryptophan 2,3-dioxygenase [Actinosynnema sp. ALI-1.44]